MLCLAMSRRLWGWEVGPGDKPVLMVAVCLFGLLHASRFPLLPSPSEKVGPSLAAPQCKTSCTPPHACFPPCPLASRLLLLPSPSKQVGPALAALQGNPSCMPLPLPPRLPPFPLPGGRSPQLWLPAAAALQGSPSRKPPPSLLYPPPLPSPGPTVEGGPCPGCRLLLHPEAQ